MRNRAFKSIQPGSEQQPTRLYGDTAVSRAFRGSDLEAHREIPPEKLEADESLSPPGTRASAGIAIAAVVAGVVAMAPTILDALPQILIPGPEQALPKLYALMGITASTVAAGLGLLGFIVIPEAAKSRQDAAKREKDEQARDRKRAAEHAAMDARLEGAIEQLEIVSRQLASLQRAQAESTTRNTRQPNRNGQRVNRREAFRGAGPGPAVTICPRWIQESRFELDSDGDYRIYGVDDEIPESFCRLETDHPTTVWTLVIPYSRTLESLQILLMTLWNIDHYSTRAAYLGRPLNLGKLRIRLIEAGLDDDRTTVILPDLEGAADVTHTVLEYAFQDVVTGQGRIAVAVKGPLYDKALERRDEALARSLAVPAGALSSALRDTLPDQHGRVSADAIRRFLETPLPSIGELRNWRLDWPENPDFA